MHEQSINEKVNELCTLSRANWISSFIYISKYAEHAQ